MHDSGVAMWSGDTSSTWASLRNQISEGQSAGLSGISYWASDIGGYQGLNVDNARGFDMDLLLRWFQFGAFCGIFRVHGALQRRLVAVVPHSDFVLTARLMRISAIVLDDDWALLWDGRIPRPDHFARPAWGRR